MQKSFRTFAKPQVLTLMAILVALQVVTRFLTISVAPWLRISFTFLPIAAASMLLGPVHGALVGGLGDVVGFFAFPTGGSYFPGFTITNVVIGLIYGLFLHKAYKDFTFSSKTVWFKLLLCELTVTIVCYLLLNTLWLTILQGKAFIAIFPARLIKNIAQFPINALLLMETGLLFKRLPASLRGFEA